ncbi:MAG: hypothetical protein IJA30_06925 [Bacilli bacterium]|nr:hypothetical protein [Bacilli bacterium]
MTQTTILEKLKIVFDVSMSSKLFIAVIAFIILLAVVALKTNKKNVKRGKLIYGLTYSLILIAILVFYHESLGKMFDYMMNNFFIVLYFPNVAVYLVAIIITNIILLISVFNFKTAKLVRNINITVYGIIHYLLALVLNVISKNNLDIFSQTSVYGNKDAQAIIEFSSAIFIVWIIFLIFYKIIRKYQKKDVVPVKRKVIVKKVRALPEGIKEVDVPLFVKAQPKKQEAVKVNEEPVIIAELVDEHKIEKENLEKQLAEANSKLKLAEEQIRIHEDTIKLKEEENYKLEEEQVSLQFEQLELQQEKIKLQQEKARLQKENQKLQESKVEVLDVKEEPKLDKTVEIMKNLDNMFTLEDYKVLATLLKEKQKKKNEQKLKSEIRKQEQLKFAQLHEAYKSVR